MAKTEEMEGVMLIQIQVIVLPTLLFRNVRAKWPVFKSSLSVAKLELKHITPK